MIVKTRFYLYFVYVFLLMACQNAPSSNELNSGNEDVKVGDNAQEDAIMNEDTIQNILFFGNSLTAGLGLEDQMMAFPALIQHKIDSLGLPYRSINAGLSGETSAGGRERIDWLLNQPISIFVLELGANDGLRGVSPASTYDNLEAIVEKVRAKNPDCQFILAGMKVPPSMGQGYFREFEQIFPDLAEKHGMVLIPFLLDNIAGIEALNQADGIHPTAAGQIIMAELVWEYLKPML